MEDIDELLQSFSAISELLQTPSLQNQLKQDSDLEKKVIDLETLVEKIKLQHGANSVSEAIRSSSLEEINAKLNDLIKHCDKNLTKFDFLKNLKPLN